MRRPGTVVAMAALVMAAASPAWAHVGGQIVALGAAPFAENPRTVSDVSRSYQDTDDEELFTGLEAEIWFNQIGIGGRYLGRFLGVSPTDTPDETYLYDWKSDLFLAYHLFRGGSFIDPYARLGTGVVMRTDEGSQIMNAGLYQYVGGGAQINLGGLVVGVGLNYNILNQRLQPEDTSWAVYPTQRFEARIYGGVSFGR